MNDGSNFLAQSIAALEKLNRQRLDPAQPDLPTFTPRLSSCDGPKIATYLDSPAGQDILTRLQSAKFAWKPMLLLDEQDSRQVAIALTAVGSPPAPPKPTKKSGTRTPRATPKPRRRVESLPEVTRVETDRVRYAYALAPPQAQQQVPAPPAPQPMPLFIHLKPLTGIDQLPPQAAPYWPPPAPNQPHVQVKRPEGFGPGQNLAIGSGFGAVTGAGLAYMLNAVRHIAPDPVSGALFAVAGAVVGVGIGGLLGAKIVKTEEVTGALLKASGAKA